MTIAALATKNERRNDNGTTRQPVLKALGLFAIAIAIALPGVAHAADYFVRDTIAERGVSNDDASAATNLVKNAVAARSSDRIVDNESADGFVLQPRLMKLGDSLVLTVEKLRGGETIFASQSKVERIEQLDGAARSATFAAIDASSSRGNGAKSAAAPYQSAPAGSSGSASGTASAQSMPASDASTMAPSAAAAPYTMPAQSAGASSARTPEVFPPGHKPDYWTIGVGPFFPHQLRNSAIMYDVAGGHVWDINPRVGVKAMAEGNFSSAKQTGTFLNFSTGANYYFREVAVDTVPYVTGDIGYGFARSAEQQTAEGFSLGLGAGYEFFRTADTTLDVLLLYNVIFDTIAADGYPSVFGARLAVNF